MDSLGIEKIHNIYYYKCKTVLKANSNVKDYSLNKFKYKSYVLPWVNERDIKGKTGPEGSTEPYAAFTGQWVQSITATIVRVPSRVLHLEKNGQSPSSFFHTTFQYLFNYYIIHLKIHPFILLSQWLAVYSQNCIFTIKIFPCQHLERKPWTNSSPSPDSPSAWHPHIRFNFFRTKKP